MTQHNNNNIRKNYKHITATISYCTVSSVKIAIGTQFKNSPFSNLVQSTHPVFAMNLEQVIKLWEYSKTPTEKYLTILGTLHAMHVLNTEQYSFAFEYTEKLGNSFALLLAYLPEYIRLQHRPRLPVYKATEETFNSTTDMIMFIKRLCNELSSSIVGLKSHVSKSEEQALRLEDEIELERMLTKILNHKDKKATRFTPKLGKWAMRQLQDSELTKHELNLIGRYILSDLEQGRTAAAAQEVIALLKLHLPYEEQRNDSLLVIRHVEHIHEEIVEYSAKFGFVVAGEEFSTNTLAAAPHYETKTAVTELVAKNHVSSGNAKKKAQDLLARIRARK